MEYLVPKDNYIVNQNIGNLSDLDNERHIFNIENKSNDGNII